MFTAQFSVVDWKHWIDAESVTEADKRIRECTATGRPCGDDAFVKHLELTTNRDFTRKKPGPKPKVKHEETPLLWTEDQETGNSARAGGGR